MAKFAIFVFGMFVGAVAVILYACLANTIDD